MGLDSFIGYVNMTGPNWSPVPNYLQVVTFSENEVTRGEVDYNCTKFDNTKKKTTHQSSISEQKYWIMSPMAAKNGKSKISTFLDHIDCFLEGPKKLILREVGDGS